jgi:hypothetical protein
VEQHQLSVAFDVAKVRRLPQRARTAQRAAVLLMDKARPMFGVCPGAQGEYVRHLREAQSVFRGDIVDSVRMSCWYQLWLFGAWKQEASPSAAKKGLARTAGGMEQSTFVFPFVRSFVAFIQIQVFRCLEPRAGWARLPNHWIMDPTCGCHLGTKSPILHAK